ncbi:MAG: hypothetical protein U0133_16760 [Gemmatimonadales bacterium]
MIRVASLRLLPLLFPTVLAAQESGAFTVARGGDTVAIEQWNRDSTGLSASLIRGLGATRERLHYHATLLPDESAPLVEVAAWRGDDPEGMPARQNTRIIFKDDSVAIDDASQNGVRTMVLPTQKAAVAYLNLSTALLEQATRRAAAARRDSLDVPFFNLGGGQTLTGTVNRVGSDSVLVRIRTVEFRFRVDPTGRILGGSVPSQGLQITRGAGR